MTFLWVEGVSGVRRSDAGWVGLRHSPPLTTCTESTASGIKLGSEHVFDTWYFTR